MTPIVEHGALERALAAVDASFGASAAHGVLSAVLCAPFASEPDWMWEIMGRKELGGDVLAGECRELLSALYDEAAATLRGGEFSFQPLLPADEAPLAARAEALAEWCSGFLSGLGIAGVGAGTRLPGESGEILDDLDRIARLRGAGDESEPEEAAYAELVEYVRVGVMLVAAELAHAEGVEPGDA